MNKIFSTAVVAVLATGAIATGAMAGSRDHSRFSQQDRYVQSYCSNNYDDGCSDWSRNHDSWDQAHYQGWYRDHYRNHDFGADNAVAGIFGFAAGVMTGSMVNGGAGSGAHVAACENRYRSYDHRSDTYLGYDGRRHDCML